MFIIFHHFGLPFVPVFPWFGMSCDVDSGTRDLGLSHLACFSLVCKFSVVVYTKCGKGAVGANSEKISLVISSMGQLEENRIFRFLKIDKKESCFIQIIFFFAKVHFMKDRENDGKIRILT